MERFFVARLQCSLASLTPESNPLPHRLRPRIDTFPVPTRTLRCSLAGALLLCAFAVPGLAADAGTAYSTYHPVVNVLDNGPPANRYDFVFAGDGYTEAEDARAQDLAREIALYLVTPADRKPLHPACQARQAGCRIDTEPYVRYRNFLNFHRIQAYSKAYFDETDLNAYGAQMFRDDRDLRRDSLFGLSVGTPQPVEATAQDSADGAGIDVDGRGWIAESGIRSAHLPWAQVSATHHLPGELFAHEGGHGNHDLMDEYHYPDRSGYYYGAEPAAWNVTTDPDCTKWREWIGYEDRRISPATGKPLGTIGCHEGAMDAGTGIYRPIAAAGSSRMWRDNPFHRVSMEKVVYDIYGSVRPLDAYRDNMQNLDDPATLWVDEVDPAVIKVDWIVSDASGNEVVRVTDAGGTLNVAALGLVAGRYAITAHAYDEAVRYAFTAGSPRGANLGDLDTLDIVRKPEVIERMQQEITWQVTVTGSPPADGDAGVRIPEGQRFTVDRQHPDGAIVGWVRASAPHGHRIELLGNPGWLGIDEATGRLEVVNAAALAASPIGAFDVDVQVVGVAGVEPVRGTVVIDVNDISEGMHDGFDDGVVGANTDGNGRGFAVPVAVSGEAVERDRRLRLSVFDDGAHEGKVVVLSKDSFELGTEDDMRIMWQVSRPAGQSADCHLLLVPARAPLDATIAQGNIETFRIPTHRPDFGLHISVCDDEGGAVLVSTPAGSAEPYRVVREWSWPERAGTLFDVILTANADGFRLRINTTPLDDALWPWPPELGMNTTGSPAEPWQHRTVRVGAMLHGRGPAALGFVDVGAGTTPDELTPIYPPPGWYDPPRPANSPPGMWPIDNLTYFVGQEVSLSLDWFFTDEDGDELEYEVNALPDGLSVDEGGKVSGTLKVAGAEQPLRVQVSDGKDAPVYTIRFDVLPDTNSPPVGSIEDQVFVVGRPVLLDLNTRCSDPDGDALTFEVHGLPAGLTASSDGRIWGTPTKIDEGEGVRVVVSDGQASVESWFMVAVEPRSLGGRDHPRPIRVHLVTESPGAEVSIDLDDVFGVADGEPSFRYDVHAGAVLDFDGDRTLSGKMPGEDQSFPVTARDRTSGEEVSTRSIRLFPITD